MKQNTYDAIIIGTGAMGSMAAWQMAKRGMRVASVEQFALGHDRGSSHGETRIIRQAYFEHPDYVPLLRSSYQLWSELEQDAQESLFMRCGLVVCGDPARSIIIKGIDRASQQFDLPVDVLSHAATQERFSQFAIPTDWTARYESNAGYLHVERAVHAAAKAARSFGCEVIAAAGAVEWRAENNGFAVLYGGCKLVAQQLIVCAGAWTSRLLPGENLPLTPRRIAVHWYASDNSTFDESKTPCFGFDTPDGFLYGFPSTAERPVKVGLHVPGEMVTDPDMLRREVAIDEHLTTTRQVVRHLPQVDSDPIKSQVCMYTMTPDENFIIDISSQFHGLSYACGFSGHGFKFAPLVGSVLADFATKQGTLHPVGFLRRQRFG